MKIAYQIKAKNGALWEAAEKVGGVPALAKHLGIPYAVMVSLMNMRHYPAFKKACSKYDWRSIERKLLELTGSLLDEIFPEELRRSEFMFRPASKTIYQEITPDQLTKAHERLSLPPSQEEDYAAAERAKMVNEMLDTLSDREARILKARFGTNGNGESTLEEIAKSEGVRSTRIRQIQTKALRKLRHPSRSRILSQLV